MRIEVPSSRSWLRMIKQKRKFIKKIFKRSQNYWKQAGDWVQRAMLQNHTVILVACEKTAVEATAQLVKWFSLPPLMCHNLIASAITVAACTDASSKPSKQLCIFYSHHRPQIVDISLLILQHNSNNNREKKKDLRSFCFYHYLLSITVCKVHPVGGAQVTYLHSRCKKLTKPVLWPVL